MKTLSVSMVLFMSFFLLQSMDDAPDDSGKLNNKIGGDLPKVNSFDSLLGSVNYPIEKMAGIKIAQTLSPSQCAALVFDVVKREDSPPELRKKRKNRTKKACDVAEVKQQLLEDQKLVKQQLREAQKLIDLRFREQLRKRVNNSKMSKPFSESDVLLTTLREIHAKKDEESSEEEN